MLVDIIFVGLVVGLLIAIYKIKFQKDSQQAHRPIIIDASAEQQPRAARGATWSTAPSTEAEAEIESDQSQEEGSNVVDMRKKLRKQQKAREKQRKKQALEQMLGQEKQKREKEEEEEAERERIEQQKKRKQEQYYKMLSQEEEKRKKAQYDKWKGMFTIDTEGKAKQSAEEQQRKRTEFLNNLLAILIKNKLSLLEDLAHKFKLTTKEVIQKIKELEELKRVKGIFDERGKYMVIQDQEWQAIRNYISARGRVKKTDIMSECARIIKIPDQDDVDNEIINLIESEGQSQ